MNVTSSNRKQCNTVVNDGPTAVFIGAGEWFEFGVVSIKIVLLVGWTTFVFMCWFWKEHTGSVKTFNGNKRKCSAYFDSVALPFLPACESNDNYNDKVLTRH